MRCIRDLLGATLAIAALCSCGGSGDTGNGTPPPPSATQFSVSLASVSVIAGSALSVTVQALDHSNDLVSSFSGTLQVSSSDPNAVLPGPQSISGGKATFVVTFDTAGSQTISVASGSIKGTSQAITVNPSLAIPTVALSNGVIGSPFSQTIQATGGVGPFAWKVSGGALPHNLSLMPTTTNVVTISGTPDTVAQAVAFTIEVTDSAQHAATQAFTVSILVQSGSLVVSPGSLDFGNQIVGSPSGALTEMLTNTANTAIDINSVVILGNQTYFNAGEFSQGGTTCGPTLAAGASCAIHLTFTPGQVGPRAAALTIYDDTADSPLSVALSGVGVTSGPNATLSAASLPVGIELVGTTSPPQKLSLSNYGTAALNIGSISATASFAETDTCVPSLASGATCTISVTFTPGGSGAVTGTLSISDDAPGAPQNVTLSGTGSTSTPALNGTCLLSCGWPGSGPGSQTDTTHCPVGQPSDHPVFAGCGLGSVYIDTARRCAVTINRRTYSGVCEVGP